MGEEGIHLISPIIGLAANVMVQVFGFRFHFSSSMLKSIVLGFGIGFMAVLACDLFFFFHDAPAIEHIIGISLANLLTYMALGYGYFHFINLGETARRVRILREINDAKGGLSIKGILSRYNGKSILAYRMNRLQNNGQILLEEGKYTIGNPTMLLITKIILLLKRIVIGKNKFD